MEATRLSLLERLKNPEAHAAWDEFHELYARPVVAFAIKRGLREADAHDVLQETMLVLIRKLPSFQYDPRTGKFRNYLLTITNNKCLEAMRRSARRKEVSMDTPPEADQPSLGEKIADDRAGDPSEALGTAWRESLREEALRRVRNDPSIRGRTFEVFRAYAVEGCPASEVAARFKLDRNNVYQIRNRILKRLEEEVRRLEAGLDGEETGP